MNEWDGSFAPFLDSYYIITYYYHYHYDDDDGLNGNEWVSERDQIRGAHPTNLCRRRPVSSTVGIIIIIHLGIMSSTRWCVSRVVLALARDNYKDVVVVFSYSSAVDLSENGFLSCCCWDDTTCFCSILQPPLQCPPSCLTVVIVLWRAIHPPSTHSSRDNNIYVAPAPLRLRCTVIPILQRSQWRWWWLNRG